LHHSTLAVCVIKIKNHIKFEIKITDQKEITIKKIRYQVGVLMIKQHSEKIRPSTTKPVSKFGKYMSVTGLEVEGNTTELVQAHVSKTN
jgi:hypothetical protein